MNIILDYLFIGFFHLGASGAALGTTLSQACSVLFALIAIKRKQTGLSLSGDCFRPQKKPLGKILNIGIPVALQDGFIHCFHCYYDHCQPARTERSRCCRHCGKNHQLSVSGSVFHAFDCFCTRSSEYRCRKV